MTGHMWQEQWSCSTQASAQPGMPADEGGSLIRALGICTGSHAGFDRGLPYCRYKADRHHMVVVACNAARWKAAPLTLYFIAESSEVRFAPFKK